MIKYGFYITLFLFSFSLFFVPVVINAQGTTFWNLERDTGVTTPNALNMYLTSNSVKQPTSATLLSGTQGFMARKFIDMDNGNYSLDPYGNSNISSLTTTGAISIGTAASYGRLTIDGPQNTSIFVLNSDVGRGLAIGANGAAGSGNAFINSTSGGYGITFGIDSTEKMRISNAGRVGIGTAAPTQLLDVNGTANITNLIVPGTFSTTNGGFTVNSAGTSRFNELKARMWSGTTAVCYGGGETVAGSTVVNTIGSCSSDIRLKENVSYFQEPVLDQVRQLKPAQYDLKDGSRKNVAGFIAQDVQKVFPETVTDHGPNEMLEFSSVNLIPHLTKAIQELSAKVDAQQKEIEQLKRQVQ